MKNYITLFLLFSFIPTFNNQAAQTNREAGYVKYFKQTKLSNKSLDLISHYKELLKAMLFQESSNGQKLVGDGGNAIGVLQLHKIMVDEVNRLLGEDRYSYEDRLSPDKSIEMFLVYQEHYNPTRNLEVAARIWNGGPSAMSNDISKDYWTNIQYHMANPQDELLAEVLINSASIQAV